MKVLIQKSGMGTAECTVAKWYKSEGDRVQEGEVIADIETAKASEEVRSPANGVLTKILLDEGHTAEVYAVLAEIDETQ